MCTLIEETKGRIRGALYGVAIGDALGAPLERMTAEEIKEKYGKVTEMVGGGWLDVWAGETTDDTAMTIAVARGIIESPDDPVPAVGRYLIDYYQNCHGIIGNTCKMSIMNALAIAEEGIPTTKEAWMTASQATHSMTDGNTASNGALMRTIYPALFYGPGAKMIKVTHDIAKMTHWDDQSTQACIQYVKDIFLLIHGYEGFVGLVGLKDTEPTGYVVDSYIVASEAFNRACSFEETIINAVNRGGDADTIGAIAGGMAGARYGYSNIPERWLEVLDSDIKEQLEELVTAAIEHQSAEPPKCSIKTPNKNDD